MLRSKKTLILAIQIQLGIFSLGASENYASFFLTTSGNVTVGENVIFNDGYSFNFVQSVA